MKKKKKKKVVKVKDNDPKFFPTGAKPSMSNLPGKVQPKGGRTVADKGAQGKPKKVKTSKRKKKG